MNPEHKLILASQSPRRQQLLKEAGINFLIKTKNIPEEYPPSLPLPEVAVYLAKLKAEAFNNEIQDETILTADTIVLIDNKILGKPSDENDAIKMLEMLSGRMHKVITGVCIKNQIKEIAFDDTTEVYFKKLDSSDIKEYVKKYKPLDKAGAYGIQEWIGLIGVEKIIGSYFNVMGLPIHKVVEELKKI